MKVMFLTMCLFFVIIALYSNPVMEKLMSEVWFADNGHFMMEFYPEGVAYFISPFYLSNGEESIIIPYDFATAPYDSVLVFDITEMIPGLNFNPLGDVLILQNLMGTTLLTMEYLSWGNGFNNTINPPLPGQSLVQSWNYHHLPESNPYTWYKEEPLTPGLADQWVPLINARDTLFITITDQDNNPVADLPLYWRETELPYGYTDNYGMYADTVLAGRWKIIIKHPLTDEIIFNNQYWLEPNQTTTISIQVNITANSDEIAPAIVQKGLQAYPSPFNSRNADAITFKYDGEAKLIGDTYIKLYDTKGRFILQIPMSAKGMASWKPSSEIGSGMYFARLISKNRIIDTTTLTIIN